MKNSTRGLTPVIRLCSLFQSRVHAGTLYLYSSKLSTLSTFVKIYLSTFVKNTLNTLNFYSTVNTLNIYDTVNILNFLKNMLAYSCKKYCQLSTLSIGQKCKRLLAKTFEKLLKNETNTLPKSLVSSVKKKLLKEKIISMFVEET